jgi:hypothetical protein
MNTGALLAAFCIANLAARERSTAPARKSRPGAVPAVRDADVRPLRGTLLLRCLTARRRDGAGHRLSAQFTTELAVNYL